MPQLFIRWLGGTPFYIDANLLVTGRTCIIGASGSGKSYTVGVICEELCKNKISFAIIDTEGEYSSIKEKCELIWIGESEFCDIKWNDLSLEQLAKHALYSPPLILDVSETEGVRTKVETFLNFIYEEVSRKRTPYLVILEEADKFVPQLGERVKIIEEITRRGRKRGLGLTLCTQRPALVDKNVLSQCWNQLIGKLVIRNDLQAVSHFFLEKRLVEQLTTLEPGYFYAIGGFSPNPVLIKIRERETKHGGFTPKLTERPMIPSIDILNKIRKSIIASVQQEKDKLTFKKIDAIVGKVEYLGWPALIEHSDIARLVSRKRYFILFGEKESIANVTLVWYPLIEVAIKVRKGVFKKEHITKYFLIDGKMANLCDLKNGLKFVGELKPFLGLNTRHIELLKVLKPEKGLTIWETANKTFISENTTRKLIKELEDKKLVTSTRKGKIKFVHRLLDLPRIKMYDTPLTLEKLEISTAQIEEIKINEKEIMEVIHGLIDESNIEMLRTFFYPLYRVELVLKGKIRKVWVDGRTGNEIKFIP
ncbi:MAG: DUF87 domain-containing protein [Nitrososphaeria archaeon]